MAGANVADLTALDKTSTWAITEVFDDLNALSLWDFRIESFGTSSKGDDVLRICGATSVYVTAATIEFKGVEFISAPTLFHHARFREATPEEAMAARNNVEFDCQLFAIDVDSAEYTFFVAAASADVIIAASHS